MNLKFHNIFFRAAFQKYFKGHPFPELLEYSTIASEEESNSSNEDNTKRSCYNDLDYNHDSKFQPNVNSDSNLTKAEEKLSPIEDISRAKDIVEENMDELEKEKMMIELELEKINSFLN